MRATEFLVEYDRAKTIQSVGQKLLAVCLKDPWFVGQYNHALPGGNIREIAKTKPNQILDYLMTIIEQADPTRNKMFTQWMARTYAKGGFKAEDLAGQVGPLLQKFASCATKKSIKAQYPIAWDINQYKDFVTFMDTVDKLPDPNAVPDAEVKPEDAGEYKQLTPNGSDVLVVQLIDEKSAGYFGRKNMSNETRWCTRHYGEPSNMFNRYNSQGPLYVIVPNPPAHTGERYQFHPPSDQYMDENDRPIGMEGVAKLVKRYPILTKVLQVPAEKYAIQPLLSDEYKNIVAKFTPEAIQRIDKLVDQYKDRIIQFGFKNLAEYGIKLPDDTKQAISQAMIPHIDQMMQAMKKSFWPNMLKEPGIERDEKKIVKMLKDDATLNELSSKSKAADLVAQVMGSTGQKLHRDITAHGQNMVVRNPLIYFCMKQIPKLYTAKLQEYGHAL